MQLAWHSHALALSIRFETGLDGKVTNNEHWMPVTMILDRERGEPHGVFRLYLELIPSADDARKDRYDIRVEVSDQPRIVARTNVHKPSFAFRHSKTMSGEISAVVFAPDGSKVYDDDLPSPTTVEGGRIKVWLSSNPEPANVTCDIKVLPESLSNLPLDLDCAGIVMTDDADFVRSHAGEFLAWQSVKPRGLVVVARDVRDPGSLGLSPSFSRPTWVGPWNDTRASEMFDQVSMTQDADLDEHSVRRLADGEEFVRAAKMRIVGAGILYALVCLPAVLAYFRFRKRGERLAWAIPVLALSAGAVIFLMAWLLHGREFVSETHTVIYHDDHTGLARSNKVWTLKAPGATDIDVVFGRGEIAGMYYDFDRKSPGLGRPLIKMDRNIFSFAGLHVGQWSKRIAIARKEWWDTPLHRHVALDGERIVIDVQNTSAESQAVTQAGKVTLGHLGPNESARWVLDMSEDTVIMPESGETHAHPLLSIAHWAYKINIRGLYLTFACDKPYEPPDLGSVRPIRVGQTLRVERISRIDEVIGKKGRLRDSLLVFPNERYELGDDARHHKTASFRSTKFVWNMSHFVAPSLPDGVHISAINFHMQFLPFKGSYLFEMAAPFWDVEAKKQVDADSGTTVDVSLPVKIPGNTLVKYGIYYQPPEDSEKKSKSDQDDDDDDYLHSPYHISLDVSR